MYCGKCGREVPDNGSFCPFCGDKTIRYTCPQTSREPEQPKEQQTRKSILFPNTKRKNGGILLLLVVAAALVLFYNYKYNAGALSPEKAVENFIEADQKRDVVKLIKCSTYDDTCQKNLGNNQYDVNEIKNQLILKYKKSSDFQMTEYKIKNTKKLNESELAETKEELEIFYKNVDNIEEIDAVELEINADEKDKTELFYCIKVKEVWYVSIELQRKNVNY